MTMNPRFDQEEAVRTKKPKRCLRCGVPAQVIGERLAMIGPDKFAIVFCSIDCAAEWALCEVQNRRRAMRRDRELNQPKEVYRADY
jgi:hypothetical protein